MVVVVAQLVEWTLTTPEIRGLNPVIVKFYLPIFNFVERTKIKKKRPRMVHLLKIAIWIVTVQKRGSYVQFVKLFANVNIISPKAKFQKIDCI